MHRLLLVGAPLVSLAVLAVSTARRASAQPGPKTLGVGAVVSSVDATSESFTVYRGLLATPPIIGGRPLGLAIVDSPAEADYAVTGEASGTVKLELDPRRWEHDLTLDLKVWAHGKKVGLVHTQCKGSVPLPGESGPPNYRYEALAPCIAAAAPQLSRLLDGK